MFPRFLILFQGTFQSIIINQLYRLSKMDQMVDDSGNVITIAVVGGGLSGLTAAQEILKKYKAVGQEGKKIEVYVLEAMDRVGGRTLTVDVEGTLYDLGGQWIGRTQMYVQKLAERAGNQLYPQYHTGAKILDLNNKVATYRTNIPLNVGILPLIEMQTLIWKIDRMAKSVDLQYPHKCSQAVYWDSLTLHSWLLTNCYSSNIKKLIECAIRAVFGVETDELSFLFFLWYTHQSSGIQNLINIQNGLQEMKMAKGAQYLSEYLKKQICSNGGKVLNNVFVSKIQKISDGTYYIYDRKQKKYQANYVIMAMPPSCINKINFQPQLSRTRRLICERSFMGSCSKVILFYEEMYWRNKGFSGETLSDCLQTPIFNAYDDSRRNSEGKIQPAILVFMNASVDREWSVKREASEKIIKETLSKYFNDERMLSPKSIMWKVWSEEQSLNGAPISVFPPGVLSKVGNIRQPEDNIHWAGTQMATKSQGFMDGAIQSGQRCAGQILHKLLTPNIISLKQPIHNDPPFYTKILSAPKKIFEWF